MSHDADTRVSIDELLEHLEDLIALARSEDLRRFAGVLEAARTMCANDRAWFGQRASTPPAPGSTARV